MTREVITAAPELPLGVAWATMAKHHFRHLPVVVEGHLVGILSDRDVLPLATLEGERLVVPDTPVREAMTTEVLTCHRSATVETLAALMLERKIDAIPIVEGRDQLVGLVTSSDLLALLTKNSTATVLPFEFQLRAVDPAGTVAVARRAR